MGPLDAIKTCLAKSFQFKGRASRSEFWWFAAFCAATELIVSLLVAATLLASVHFYFGIEFVGLNSLAVVLVLSVPMAAAGARRLQDVGEDGYLIALPIATYLILWLLGNGPYSIALPNGIVLGIGSEGWSLTISIWSLIIVMMTLCSILLCYRLTWHSDPGTNDFGPNPNEVPQ